MSDDTLRGQRRVLLTTTNAFELAGLIGDAAAVGGPSENGGFTLHVLTADGGEERYEPGDEVPIPEPTA
jgi:hypothetical protein